MLVLAFISPTLFGLVPIGGNDIRLHAIVTLGLAYIGFAGKEPARAV